MITGEVAAKGAQSFQLKGAHGTYTILSSEAVQRGDAVTVVGTLQPAQQLRPVAMFASPQVLDVLVYERSFVALIVLAVLFLVNWRFDWRTFVVRPREQGRDTPQRRGD